MARADRRLPETDASALACRGRMPLPLPRRIGCVPGDWGEGPGAAFHHGLRGCTHGCTEYGGHGCAIVRGIPSSGASRGGRGAGLATIDPVADHRTRDSMGRAKRPTCPDRRGLPLTQRIPCIRACIRAIRDETTPRRPLDRRDCLNLCAVCYSARSSEVALTSDVTRPLKQRVRP